MGVLDEEGQLFGVVNVVDLLAVLFAAALVVAGVAFVTGSPAGTEVRYATLDLGVQPPYVAEQISAGDVAPFAGATGNLTVFDVFVTPAGDSAAHVIVRARVRGTLERDPVLGERVFSLAGTPLRSGAAFNLTTADYRVHATVTSVERTGATLDVSRVPVLVEATVPTSVAAAVTAGDEYRLAGRTVASVERVVVYPTGDPGRRRLVAGLGLRTVTLAGDTRFAGQRVAVGSKLAFDGPTYDFAGHIVRRGHLAPRGTPVTTTAVVKLANVPPALADAFRVGMTETTRGTTLARVTALRVEPAVVVLASDDGDLHVRQHPRNKDVYLTVELRTRRTANGLAFHGRPLHQGATVVLRLEAVTVEANVVELR